MLWEQSCYIYNLLQDAESKRVFNNRLMYGATNDDVWIKSLTEKVNVNGTQEKIKQMYKNRIYNFVQEMRNDVVEIIENELVHKNVVVCPALGKDCINFLRMLKDTRNIVLCDKRANGQFVYGKEVISTEEAAKSYSNSLWIVLSANFNVEIRSELMDKGINAVYVNMQSYDSIMKKFGQDYVLKDLTCIELMEETYFDKSIMLPSEKEIFVDCGFYDGFSTEQFIKWSNNDYEKIIAFEPDEKNYKMIMKMKQIDRLEIHNVGCWNEKTILSFNGGKGEASRVDALGNEKIYVDTIDNILAGDKCTVIKMDIEGAELEALRGAEKTIKKWKPRLAISVYHKPEDIIDIPMYLLSICPEYKLYMRHYTYGKWDTVLYAVI